MEIKAQKWQMKFIVLWSGQGVSIFTSSVIQMAIIWYLTYKTGSAAMLSFATLVGFLPQAILGTFIGVLIDRYDRKFIMIVSDVFIALSSLVLVVAGFYGEIPIWLVMVVLFVRSIGAAFHYPSLQAVTPLIVPKEQLTRYAGYSQSFESMSFILSPALAALLYGVWNLNIIILLDVFGAMFAVLTLCIVKIPKPKKTIMVGKSSVINEAKQGFDVLRKEPGMVGLILIGALYAMIYFPIGTLYPLICMSYFGGGFVESGIVEVIFAVGMLLGSLALGIWGNKVKRMGAIPTSIGIYGLGLLITGLLPQSGFIIFAGLSIFMGFSVPFFTGIMMSIFQTKIKEDYLGRVLSLSSSISMIAMPLGLGLSGVFAEIIGVEKWFFLSGILTLMLSLFSIMLPSVRKCYD